VSLTPGDKLGRYAILGRIGAGGMGEIYRARDTDLGRGVAIKTSAHRFSERVERGAKLIRR
jgi:serine/threonine protein kinase